MKLNKDNNVQLLSNRMIDFFNVQDYKDILQFAVQDIDLSDDVSSDKDRIDLVNYPHIVQPLSHCTIEDGIRKEVVICFPEQLSKTTIQMIALLYNTVFNVMQAIICYPSLDLAVETSTVKFIPLFKKIPQFKEQIEQPFAIRSDRLKLSKNLIYWQGAGTKIVSKSCKMVLADQASIWETPHGINNLNELKKRTRSYNECLQLFVSSPRYKQDAFWRQFLGGSQGYYYLRCCKCGELSMRSCDIHNLQFQSIYNQELKQYIVVRGSERLVCPLCHYQHDEYCRQQLVKQGKYVHTFEDKIESYPTFQAGVLASLLNVHSWSNIADIQLASGKNATLQDNMSWDNSYRGLPFQGRNYNKQDETAISKHFFNLSEIKKDDIEAIYIAADTQDTFSVLAVIALTKNDNLYVLDVARPRYLFLDDNERKIINSENERNGKQPEKTVLDYINAEYCGIKPLCALIDMRGHRSQQIKNFAKMQKNILMYAGSNLRFDKWKISENNPKLFICDAKKFQADLIFKLYFQNNKQSNYLFLPLTLTEKDIEQITSFQPNNEKRNGNLYQEWIPGKNGDAVHDLFDTLKMGLCAVAISAKIYRKERFLHGEARILNANKNPLKKETKKPMLKKPIIKRNIFSY